MNRGSMGNNDNQQKHPARPFRFLLRIPVPWVYVLAYIVGVGLEILLPFDFQSFNIVLYFRFGGALLFFIGAVLAGWGLFVFRKAHTTTVPGEKSQELVKSGPYRFSRNPMYVGLGFAYIGEAGWLTQIWPLLLLPLLFYYINQIVIPLEETRLRESFGNEYEQYCAGVRRWI